MDPNESVNKLLEQTAGRSDAVFLSVVVIILCGVVLLGAGYIMIKWMPALLQNFREEMKLEREYHQKQVDQILASHERFQDKMNK